MGMLRSVWRQSWPQRFHALVGLAMICVLLVLIAVIDPHASFSPNGLLVLGIILAVALIFLLAVFIWLPVIDTPEPASADWSNEERETRLQRWQAREGRPPLFVEDMFSVKLNKPIEAMIVGADGSGIVLADMPPGTIGWTEDYQLTMSSESLSACFLPDTTVLTSRWNERTRTTLAAYRSDEGILYLLRFTSTGEAPARAAMELSSAYTLRAIFLGDVDPTPLRG